MEHDREAEPELEPEVTRSPGARAVVGLVAVLLVILGIVTWCLRDQRRFVDHGAVTTRVELPLGNGAFIEPAGPAVRPTITAEAAFEAVDDQRYPGEHGRPEVMFGAVTIPGSHGWDHHTAWIILRRHVLATATQFANRVDAVDPVTGEHLVTIEASEPGEPVSAGGAG